MSSNLVSMIVGAPSQWLRLSRSPAWMAGAGLLGVAYWLLHSQNQWSGGAVPLVGLAAALMGWQAGLHGRQRPQAQPLELEDVPPATVDLLPVPVPEPVSAPLAGKPVAHWTTPHTALLISAFEQSGSAMVITDALDRVVLLNDAFVALTGVTPERALGQPAELLGIQPLRPSHLPGIDLAMRRGERWSGEASLRGTDGEHHDWWLAVSTVRDQERRITHHTRVFQDVEPLKAQLRQMADQARHDSLTGLANRRAFGELMFQAMARTRRYTKTLAIMCVDLDGFKNVNDTHGHQTGDLLLVAVARRLEACVRTTDRVCRMGGDEFMLILEGPGQTQEITRIGERVLQSIKEPYSLGDDEINISSSIGVVVYDGQENDQGLIKRADDAMYAAKHAGKSQMVFVAPSHERPVVMEPPRMVSQRA